MTLDHPPPPPTSSLSAFTSPFSISAPSNPYPSRLNSIFQQSDLDPTHCILFARTNLMQIRVTDCVKPCCVTKMCIFFAS
uniref:Predicted protein n=1 Tax=Hordeum vulgare subsp. vulgare TaxID=112509 RepID=F2D4B1_HORVV|nr:predicted protein [Hordeum vulgare subsp. vulgare]